MQRGVILDGPFSELAFRSATIVFRRPFAVFFAILKKRQGARAPHPLQADLRAADRQVPE